MGVCHQEEGGQNDHEGVSHEGAHPFVGGGYRKV